MVVSAQPGSWMRRRRRARADGRAPRGAGGARRAEHAARSLLLDPDGAVAPLSRHAHRGGASAAGATPGCISSSGSRPRGGGVHGACHALDLPFSFGNLDAPGMREFAGAGAPPQRLAEQMMDAWCAFARSGDPSHAESARGRSTSRRAAPRSLWLRCAVVDSPCASASARRWSALATAEPSARGWRRARRSPSRRAAG